MVKNLNYSPIEQMIVSAARLIKDNEVIFVGVGIPQLAAWLAKYTHAPNCVIVHEVGIIRTIPCQLGLFVDSLYVQNLADMLSGLFYVNALAANDCYNRAFIGAGQIDRYGNINSTVVGNYYHPIHRWPGSGGGNDVMSLCRNVVIMLKQDKRRFPERVDFITSPGYLDGIPNQREKEGLLPMTGPSVVVTDMAIYHFIDGEMVLKSIHNDLGVTLEDIKREIGWSVKIDQSLEVTKPPSDEELDVLREKVDPQKIFKFASKSDKF